MTILLNLHGAMHQLKTSSTNRETVETIHRLTQELYRTVGVLFYTRYLATVRNAGGEVDEDLRDHISQYMEKPTFDSWIKLARKSVKLLCEMDDRFATEYIESSEEPLDSDLNATARDVLIAIQRYRAVEKYRPQKKVKPGEVLEFILHLRNTRSHTWDSEGNLQGLMDAGLKELIPALMDLLLRFAKAKILIPCSASVKGIRTIVTDGFAVQTRNIKDHSTSGLAFDSCYIQYYDDEDPFLFKTDLIRYDSAKNYCFVYQEFSERKKVSTFEAVPLQGTPTPSKHEVETHEALFGISSGLEELPPGTDDSGTVEELIYRFFAQLRKGSTGVVAGTHLTSLQQMIYTQTAIDRNFWAMLEEENPDLVIIAGNAGDGKSTLMKMLENEHGDQVNGRNIKWNFDATHSESASEKQVDTLRRYFSAFSDDKVGAEPDDVYIVAMNTGMALSFFEDVKSYIEPGNPATSFSYLGNKVKSMMDIPGKRQQLTTGWKVMLFDLGRRALFNIDTKTDRSPSLVSDLLSRLVSLNYWNNCPSCPMYKKCFIIANIQLLRKKSVVRYIEYLLMRASYSSKTHFTIRDFWEFISEVVGGRTNLHEQLKLALADKTCVKLMEYLADWPLYGDFLASLITNSLFQDKPFFDEGSKVMFSMMSDILAKAEPEMFDKVVIHSELTNEFAQLQRLSEAPRILRDVLSHDPAGLSGVRIDTYSELAASKLLGPEPESVLEMIDDLLPQEQHSLQRNISALKTLLKYSTDPDLKKEEADWLPIMVKELTRSLITSMKRRYVFASKHVKPTTANYDELYSRDYVTRFVKDVILKTREYVFDGRKKTDTRRRQLINHLLIDLLPAAVMVSDGLSSREVLGLKRDEFYISLDERYNRGELAQYIAATPVRIDGSSCEMHLGNAFEKYSGCMATVRRYDLFDPVPMEIYVDFAVEGKRSTDFKIDATTYGLLKGMLEGRQPSLVEDLRYRNFEVVKRKIRELARDRSQMVYYDLYGAEVLRIEPDVIDRENTWKIETGG
jgi:hypothetical protein